MNINLYKSKFAPLRNTASVMIAVCALALSASAELGGNVSTVQSDMARMKGAVKVTEQESYAVHEITASGGTKVREFVSPEGKVFGVAWSGPFVPDLHQLFGVYFPLFSQAVQNRRPTKARRRPVSVYEPGLIVQTAGHLRAYMGRAYDPTLIPQGVSAGVIQ